MEAEGNPWYIIFNVVKGTRGKGYWCVVCVAGTVGPGRDGMARVSKWRGGVKTVRLACGKRGSKTGVFGVLGEIFTFG